VKIGLFALIPALVPVVPASAQTPTGSVAGRVTDSQRQPVATVVDTLKYEQLQ
jgi:hypothetical protein